jgi:hypothetical protein
LILVLFSYQTGLSQEKDYRSTVSIGVGQSMVKVLSDLFLSNNNFLDSTGLNYTALPAFYVNYDFFVTDFFSVGAAGSYQMLRLKNIETSDYIQINRSNFGVRALFHYSKTEKLDMYSGVRMSTTMWKLSSNSVDPTIQASLDDLNSFSFFDRRTKFAPQIIAFGVKGYFTEMFGAHMELSLGSPYYLSGGINVRF